MLNPDQIGRFRRKLAQESGPTTFEGIACHARPLAFRRAPAIEILAEEEEAPLLRAGPVHVFGTPADPSCLDGVGTAEIWTPRKRIHRLPGARIIGNDVVIAEDGLLFCPDPLHTPRQAAAFAAGPVDHHGFVLAGELAEYRAWYFGRPSPRRIEADALFLHNLEPGNYGSFLFRQLPQMVLAARADLGFDCYVTPERTVFFREALDLLGLPRRPVYTLREVCGDPFRSVILASNFDAEGVFSASVVDAFRALTRRVGRTEGALAAPCLYVSRDLANVARPGYRPLLNEAELEAIARAEGYETCRPETMSLAQQIATFAAARTIAGPSGSGMLNAAFAPPGAAVLDLESFHVTVRQHANVYASTGKRYAFAFGAFASEEGDRITRPWRLDPEVFRAGLAWMARED